MTRRDYEIAGLALADWVQWAQELGRRCHIPPEELVYLLLTVTDVDRLALRLGMVGDRQLIHSQFDLATLTDCWKQRCYDRIPVQY
ncbi:MAG: protein-(glutamine-N5) methyltransferase, release factor-specific, partial [Cyanobacteria bacterium P01_D01_bin.73]